MERRWRRQLTPPRLRPGPELPAASWVGPPSRWLAKCLSSTPSWMVSGMRTISLCARTVSCWQRFTRQKRSCARAARFRMMRFSRFMTSECRVRSCQLHILMRGGAVSAISGCWRWSARMCFRVRARWISAAIRLSGIKGTSLCRCIMSSIRVRPAMG